DAYAPGYRKQTGAIASLRPATFGAATDDDAEIPVPSQAAAAVAPLVMAGLREMQRTLHANETELGRIDAVAGDGDHGRGMAKGIDAALAAVTSLEGAGPAWILRCAGRAWAAGAGGTSGVLWGAGLEAAGDALTAVRDEYGADVTREAVAAFTAAIRDLGRAEPVDALLPFQQELGERLAAGQAPADSWRAAAGVATTSAAATAQLTPKKGRARPLAEKSVGTPDAGATSFALLVEALGALSASAR